MTDEKNTPSSAPPPAITPRKAVPRPPGPAPAPETLSTDHFSLPDVDLETLSKLPDFSGVTSSPIASESATGSVRHSARPIGSESQERAEDEGGAGSDADEGSGVRGIGSKMKGWAGAAVSSVKKVGSNRPADDEFDAETPKLDLTPEEAADPMTATATAPKPMETEPGGPGAVEESDAPARPSAVAQSQSGPRKVRLAIARLDPWSVMKLSFLMSVAFGIMIVVASWVFWYALNNLGVFTSIDELIRGIAGEESDLDILQYLGRDRVLSLATLIAVVDVVLLTALATIGAFLYNVVAALVGGIHMTMTDD